MDSPLPQALTNFHHCHSQIWESGMKEQLQCDLACAPVNVSRLLSQARKLVFALSD